MKGSTILPICWIVKVREDPEKEYGVKISKTVPESIKDGKDQVKAVTHRDHHQDAVETVPHLLPVIFAAYISRAK